MTRLIEFDSQRYRPTDDAFPPNARKRIRAALRADVERELEETVTSLQSDESSGVQ